MDRLQASREPSNLWIEEFLNTIEVIQGCTLSHTSFGIFIDNIKEWLEACDNEDVKLENFVIKDL